MTRFIWFLLISFFSITASSAVYQAAPLQPNPYLTNTQATSPTSFKLGVQDSNSSFAPSHIGIIGLKYLHRSGQMSTVIDIYPGTPAEKAGIRIGDRLIEVDGTSIMPFSADQVFGLIAGRPGEPVDLKLMRCDSNYGSHLGCRTYQVNLVRMDMNMLNSDQVYRIYRYTN